MPVPAITGRWTSYVVPGGGLGTGPWEHAPNRGFLRSLYALGRAAAAINENDEAERCATFPARQQSGSGYRPARKVNGALLRGSGHFHTGDRCLLPINAIVRAGWKSTREETTRADEVDGEHRRGACAGISAVIVVGAGISGVAAAREVYSAGLPVRLVDRGDRIGGEWRGAPSPAVRSTSARRCSPCPIRPPLNRRRLGESRGLARPLDRHVRGRDTVGLREPATESDAVRHSGWAAPAWWRTWPPAWTSGTRATSPDHRRSVVDGQAAPAAVLAMPDPQAQALLAGGFPAERVIVAGRRWEPVLAMLCALGPPALAGRGRDLRQRARRLDPRGRRRAAPRGRRAGARRALDRQLAQRMPARTHRCRASRCCMR